MLRSRIPYARRQKLGLLVICAVALSTIATLGCQPRAESGEAGWELLGTKSVTFRNDTDNVVVTAKEGTFRRIQIVVAGNDLEMHDIMVVYANGERENIDTRMTFREGSWSRVIDLKGWSRIIRRVEFKYHSTGRLREGRATVKLYGKH